ncbi:uncharacterized protein BX664DRAFT_359447 [Halteromyces radiatus]|uniref:uncharacterized protein n=1 Tax=Halteromyces radiatus TaxID=101107 RepID=UPI00221E7DB3|nr:uncharacterized protein BX664DRAFT_359447 [Halteromyces radiatus]KAI8089967.1 hypothetical protein BX664DRAFT_359447 [Halteromyces radiatus]
MEGNVSQRRLYNTPTTSHSKESPHLFIQYDKRWRWWHILFLIIVLIGLIELILILVGYIFLHFKSSPIRIELRQYPKIKYQPLDQTTYPSFWRNSTSVYHITKEFGPATMGGMGMVLTALTTEQQRTGQLDVNIVLPYYSYLKHKQKGDELHRVTDLVMYIQDKHNTYSTLDTNQASSLHSSSLSTATTSTKNESPWVPLEFRVTKWKYTSIPPPPAVNQTTWYIDDRGNNQTLPADMQRPSLKHEQLTVYLIGPGNRSPFSMAFRARNPVGIYSSPKGLPQEWKDQYFLKAAATFLSFQASAASHDQSLFAPTSDLVSPAGVDVVHIHGATNAYLAHYLQDPTLWNAALPRPSVVYTMHDYLDELQYTNTIANVHKFDPTPPQTTTIIHGNKMFMSSLAIELANVVTFVSQTMAMEMVEGQMDFYLKELVMEAILQKADQGRFFGISNGVDYRHAHPFHSKRLTKSKLAYPSFAWQQLVSHKSSFTLSNHSTDYISIHKDRAKRWLVRKKVLAHKDKQLVLFVGRFQYNKGLASFERAIASFIEHDMVLVIIGQPNNYPLAQVKQWQEDYPDHVYVMTTAQEQKRWLMYVRAAADLVFVPSVTESFGLVAAEGMMFGAPVLSTGVGGLKEFLVDRSLDNYNAYLYQLDNKDHSLETAIAQAAHDYRYFVHHRSARELFLLRLIKQALALGWTRPPSSIHHHPLAGPVYDYIRVYAMAIQDQHNKMEKKEQ